MRCICLVPCNGGVLPRPGCLRFVSTVCLKVIEAIASTTFRNIQVRNISRRGRFRASGVVCFYTEDAVTAVDGPEQHHAARARTLCAWCYNCSYVSAHFTWKLPSSPSFRNVKVVPDLTSPGSVRQKSLCGSAVSPVSPYLFRIYSIRFLCIKVAILADTIRVRR